MAKAIGAFTNPRFIAWKEKNPQKPITLNTGAEAFKKELREIKQEVAAAIVRQDIAKHKAKAAKTAQQKNAVPRIGTQVLSEQYYSATGFAAAMGASMDVFYKRKDKPKPDYMRPLETGSGRGKDYWKKDSPAVVKYIADFLEAKALQKKRKERVIKDKLDKLPAGKSAGDYYNMKQLAELLKINKPALKTRLANGNVPAHDHSFPKTFGIERFWLRNNPEIIAYLANGGKAKKDIELSDYYSAIQLAAIAKISVSAMLRRIRAGELPKHDTECRVPGNIDGQKSKFWLRSNPEIIAYIELSKQEYGIDTSDYYNSNQLAEIIGIGYGALRWRAKNGKIPPHDLERRTQKNGGGVLASFWRKDNPAIIEYIANNKGSKND